MKTLLDLHTHTIMSGHAYSTLQEMVAAARDKGLTHLGITEHGPALPGACHPIYFRNLHVVPRVIDGVNVMMGAELNILNVHGDLDMDEDDLRNMSHRIAGIHKLCWEGGSRTQNTDGLIGAIEHPWVNIISHPGDGTAELCFEPIVLAAKAKGVLLEINNSSMKPCRGKAQAVPNNLEILRLCRQYDVPVILGSDAHISYDIGNYEYALPLLAEAHFPESLVVNDKPELFFSFTGLQP